MLWKFILTHKWLEMHDCIISTLGTDDLVLEHQAISIHSADYVFTVLDQFHTKHVTLAANKFIHWNYIFWKKWPSRLRVNMSYDCHAEIFLEKHKLHLNFTSIFDAEMLRVLEIHLPMETRISYTVNIKAVGDWWWKDPGHQQSWYSPSLPLEYSSVCTRRINSFLHGQK